MKGREFLKDSDKIESFNKFEKTKYNFLSEIDSIGLNTKKTYWKVLNGIEYVEIANDKNIYELTQNEIEDMIKNLPTVSRSVKKATLSAVSKYFDWAVQSGFIEENVCEAINLKEALAFNKTLVKDTYQSLDKFYEMLDTLEDVSDIDKMALTMLRYDIPIKNCGSVKWEDVNVEDKIVTVLNEKNNILNLPIDDRFIERVKRAKNCTINRLNNNIFYNDNGYILKMNSNSNAAIMVGNTVYGKIKSINSKNKTNISKIALFKARKVDLLLDAYNRNKEVTKEDIWNTVELLDGYCSEDKCWNVKTYFESVTDIKTVTEKQLKKRATNKG